MKITSTEPNAHPLILMNSTAESNLFGKTSEPTLQSFLVPPRQRRQKCRAADIPCKATFNCQPGKVDLEEPTQEMQG